MRESQLEILKEVNIELSRFKKKLALAINECEHESDSHKSYASAKRSALDLKNELTKFTQDSKYIYRKRN